jgi:hypothetical protein
VAVIGTVTELDMVLQFMNYKGNLTDLVSRGARVVGEIKNSMQGTRNFQQTYYSIENDCYFFFFKAGVLGIFALFN